jgi:nucleoside-diphosphate-sugar epimerase
LPCCREAGACAASIASPSGRRAGRLIAAAVQWITGDGMQRDDVIAAADGADVIVHGVNPPGYRNWRGLALPMLESSIAAAKASGARLVFPGTVYNFGPDAFPNLTECSPQARWKRGSRPPAATACARSSCAPDFFGPRTGNSWFAQGLIKPGKPDRSILYPGKLNVGHAWAYLPDVATTTAQLLEREAALDSFDVFHFAGHWCEPGAEMAHAIQHAVGEPKPSIRQFPWLLAYALSPFVTVFREMLELRYLWQRPVRLDNAAKTHQL